MVSNESLLLLEILLSGFEHGRALFEATLIFLQLLALAPKVILHPIYITRDDLAHF